MTETPDQRYGWIALGRQAFGLIEVDHVVAVVYWSSPDVGVDESSEPVVADAGYFLVDCGRPTEHVWIVDGVEWEEARARAAREFHHRRQLRGESDGSHEVGRR